MYGHTHAHSLTYSYEWTYTLAGGCPVRDEAEELSDSQEGGLLAAYGEMAADQQREAEAQEWSEGLINDASHRAG